MLLRLYFDGADEIAWHTDGRTFLGPTPTIASLSFGAEALFQMRRMRNVWPCAGDNGIDATTPIRDFPVGDGEKEAGLWRSTLWRAHHTTPTPTTRHAPGHERRHPEALAPPGKNATGHIDRVFVTTRESWANVNWKGNWNSEHSHSKVTISGAYYVQSSFPKRIQKPISRE